MEVDLGPTGPQIPQLPEMGRGAQLVFQKMGELIGDILTVVDVDMFG